MIKSELHIRIKKFHENLSDLQKQEFRQLLDSFAHIYYDVGEIFKMAYIDLIPSKVLSITNLNTNDGNLSQHTISTGFKPQAKVKGDPLQELASALSSEDREKLIAKLGGK